MPEPKRRNANDFALADDPLWYKDAVIYEVHVRSFHDSNGDGIGDFRGLTRKLDYLEDLGVTALWLLPFYPSPLRDDGYDIADYTAVHPDYGTLADFARFLKEAHRRGIRVITELVINHTSDQHPWFQRAREARPNGRRRNWYVWSDTSERYADARIIFQDFELSNWTWDPVAGAYYWHRFYSHQPDLNFDNPAVRKAVLEVLDFWFEMGIDGMRLDAVPYLFEREGTSCENLPETHAFLRDLRRHVDSKYKNKMLLSEANQWPEDAVEYFGQGDETHMAFHFPLMPRLFVSLRMEDRFPIVDILDQTPDIPESCQWAVFLRNHDELTLEMVTDEDRDYMRRAYAEDPQMRINLGIRRRLSPLLNNLRRKIELMNGLLFSMPGTPVLYYGDEIGMGDNVYLGDRNGVRTPMQWSADRNAGFSRANPQKLYLPIIIDPEYHYEAVNVEAQQGNPHSLLWWTKRLIALRKQHPAFSRGDITFLSPDNNKILAFLRQTEQENVLVVVNLSRYVQHVELDLSSFRGMVPVEMFGRTRFPSIGELPYRLTIAPHCFYWFTIEGGTRTLLPAAAEDPIPALPKLFARGSWEALLAPRGRKQLERALASFLTTCRWFGEKGASLSALQIAESIRIPTDYSRFFVLILKASYRDTEPHSYLLPIAHVEMAQADRVMTSFASATIARVEVETDEGTEEGFLYDGMVDDAVATALFRAIAGKRRLKGESGELRPLRRPALQQLWNQGEPVPPCRRFGNVEQSNTSVVFGDRLILKLFRRLEEGPNPDLELGRFLTERTDFTNISPVAGALGYASGRKEPATVALLQKYVPNEGDAWAFTRDYLRLYFEAVSARTAGNGEACSERAPLRLTEALQADPPASATERFGHYLQAARLLGQRTAELHVALASNRKDPVFRPEAYTAQVKRSVYESLRSRASKYFQLLKKQQPRLPEDARAMAKEALVVEPRVFQAFKTVLYRRLTGLRIRTHGDYHLGQVLHTGNDFVIIDFEGEPALPLYERRYKRSPLRDVAGMIRSFHYAAHSLLFQEATRPEDVPALEPWAEFWFSWTATEYLKAYLAAAAPGRFLPADLEETQTLLDAFLLEKALYEIAYEINNRPTWVTIPIRGILNLLREE